jgi:hypothetical protein
VPAVRARESAAGTYALAAALLLSELAFVAGAAWDIQWHYAIGRDRPFIPPHLLLLAGIALTGILALAGVLRHSFASRRDPSGNTIGLFRFLRAPLGMYLAGFGALSAALAFPWDDYWHRLYGVDVTLWAPFHVMIIAGMALAALGTTYLFASGGAASGQPGGRTEWGRGVGMALSFSMVAAVMLLLQAQALDREGILSLREARIIFPPLLVGLTIPWLVAAALAVPFPGGATLTALGLLGVRLALFAFVPAALRWAAALEGARIREDNMFVTATPYAFPAWAVVAGLVIDLVWWAARTRRLPLRPVPALVLAGTLGAMTLGVLDRPWEITLPAVRGGAGLNLRAALLNSLPAVAVAGAFAAVYGAGLGGALRASGGAAAGVRSRGALPVLYFLSLALAAAAAWTLLLALQREIGLLPLPPTPLAAMGRAPVPHWLGWVIGLLPAWALLGFVLSQTLAARRSGGLDLTSNA